MACLPSYNIIHKHAIPLIPTETLFKLKLPIKAADQVPGLPLSQPAALKPDTPTPKRATPQSHRIAFRCRGRCAYATLLYGSGVATSVVIVCSDGFLAWRCGFYDLPTRFLVAGLFYEM